MHAAARGLVFFLFSPLLRSSFLRMEKELRGYPIILGRRV
jgi:hypothetical protein